MGRIKTTLVKRVTLKVIDKYSDQLKKDFDENKKILVTLVDFPSKKIRNIVAGYATRLMKTKE
ncbi:30S ribosomal protein S17e [Candidatus Woesearchaeota archaeon]|nr:30S ribosomal protein S17e [Candidatus Woesearchaeota archaeon]